MSGTCSAHKHYERDCPRCQTEKPEWVQALEAENAALKRRLAGLQFQAEEMVPVLNEQVLALSDEVAALKEWKALADAYVLWRSRLAKVEQLGSIAILEYRGNWLEDAELARHLKESAANDLEARYAALTKEETP